MTFVHNLLRGPSWKDAMPDGYGLSLLGAGIFLATGAGDMLWHTIFWIEINLEALLSPTHLLRAVSIHENFEMLLLGILSGLAADFLNTLLKPSAENPGASRWFAFSWDV